MELGSHGLCVWFPPSQYLQPLTLVSYTPDLLLDVRDAKKNETDSSLDQEAPKEEDGPAPPKLTSARLYRSVPNLRNSSLLCCSRLISRIKEVKSASAVNIFTGTLPLSSVETSPESSTQVSDSPESLLSMTVTTSFECRSPELNRMVSAKCEQQQIPQHLIQQKRSKIFLPTKSQHFLGNPNPSSTSLKNKQHLLSELFTKVQLKEFLFPDNFSLSRSRSSGEKRPLDMPSLLHLQSSHSNDVSLRDLLVVATPARLDPRPGRSYTGAMKDPCIQDQGA